jgi:hypothetical protein
LQLEPKEWPPNFDDDSISSEVIIFCNVYEFEIRGDLYVHSDRRIIFEGPPGGLCVSDAGEKPNAETSWIPLPGKTPEEERKINIVFMCSMLEPYKDDPKVLLCQLGRRLQIWIQGNSSKTTLISAKDCNTRFLSCLCMSCSTSPLLTIVSTALLTPEEHANRSAL